MKTERMRGHAWMAKIDEVRRANPLCVRCQAKGIIRLFEEVDHIIALDNGGTNDDDNLQGLCKPCHVEKTAEDMGWPVRRAIGVDGVPEGWK